jgi:uncharacterized protein (DUF849 family)
MTPVIIEVAVNGVTTREQNPNVPLTAEEIAADAIACLDAGATIVHAHCDPGGGTAEEVAGRYLDAFARVWEERPGALVYPTLNYDLNDRFGHLALLAAEGLRIGVLDPGSLNLRGVGPDGMPAGDSIYSNTFDTIRRAFALHIEHGLGPSLAIYEPGFLRTALAFWRGGGLPPGAMIKLYLSSDRGLMGSPFGLPVTTTGLDAYLELLDGCPLPWAVSAVGDDLGRSDLLPYALARGGHVHIGLEFHGGDRRPSNVELVREAAAVCADAGRPLATHQETVALLDLPGGTP